MRFVCTVVLGMLFLTTGAQPGTPDVKVTSERKENGFVLYASNSQYCPVSLLFNFELQNVSFSGGGQKVFVVPAQNGKWKIGELTVTGKGATKFSFRYFTELGDVTVNKWDTAYPYDLPFKKGASFRIFQGYNGTFSHTNENALDFSMPEGTELFAAREGVVVKVVQNNNQSCPSPECQQYNNYIAIYHPDGTIARYVHLRYNGANVRPGDVIRKGQLIGYSGNTGWTSGPHLHFVCTAPNFEKKQTMKTLFRINKGEQVVYLEEKQTYLRDY